MRLIHITCLRPLHAVIRTVVSQPADPTWPKDFIHQLHYCDVCGTFPLIEEIKKEETEAK